MGTATLDDGTQIAAAQATRLACEARIIPVVLGGIGEVLHQGRARRAFTAAQTYAITPATSTAPPAGATGHQGCATPTTHETTTHADHKVTFHRHT